MEINGILHLPLGDLGAIDVPFGPKTVSLAALVDRWCDVILAFTAELEVRDPTDDVRTADDFVGALFLRSAIAEGLASVHGDRRVRISAVELADHCFFDFTENDSARLLQFVDPSAPDRDWWWKRIPRTGPIRAAIDAAANS